ncbi:unnamed protein product [Caenorhabditis auriculariae]|uniref:AAA+ ATPase domain-containing protein n=1 Tax=Caenorhabditis auriculariae TaxID=2777116 RepID=A0A8S1GNU5_9PELO|nr:unnamed protein product [Caenorhabditis auriculariae]
MSSKKKPLLTCSKCNAVILSKDAQRHVDFCSLPIEQSETAVIKDDVLRGWNTALDRAETFLPPDALGWEREHAVLMHPQTMEQLHVLARQPILVLQASASFVAVVWPCKELALLRVHVVSSLIARERFVVVRKLSNVRKSSSVLFDVVKSSLEITSSLRDFAQMYLSNAYVQPGVECALRYYGQSISLIAQEPVDEKFARLALQQPSEDPIVLFLPQDCLVSLGEPPTVSSDVVASDFSSIGGMFSAKQILFDYVVAPVRSNCDPCSLLLWGLPGSGKSFLLREMAKVLGSSCIYFSNADELAEKGEALIGSLGGSQSLVVVVDINELDKEVSKASLILARLLSSQHRCTVVLALRSADSLDLGLRVRFPVEAEVTVPTQEERVDVLRRISQHLCLSEEELAEVSKLTHGFTAGDLCSLLKATPFARGNTDFQKVEATRKRMRPTGIRQFILEVPNVTWDDIGGNEELKLEIQQAVIWPQKHADAFQRFGIDPPAGILLYGPPGCSKTLVARALANEAKMNFLAVKGPELFSKWVGDSEKAIRDLFSRARQVSPTIVFFDEIDAVGSSRGSESSSGVSDRVLAQLLTELDGLEKQSRVVLLAATNRPDQLDSALLRPGRLDRAIYVGLPCQTTRRAILEMRTRKTKLAEDVSLQALVALTEGYSGAELVAVCRTAAMIAMREDLEAHTVHFTHFQKALEAVVPRTEQYLLDIYSSFRVGKAAA